MVLDYLLLNARRYYRTVGSYFGSKSGSRGIKKKSRRENKEVRRIIEQHPAIANISHPSRTLVLGKSQSGKTTLAVNLIKKLQTEVDETWVCSPTFDKQDTWKNVHADMVFTDLSIGLKELDEYIENDNANSRILFVMDDVSFEGSLNAGAKGLLAKFAYNARWMNLTFVVICHKMSAVSNAVKENAEHLILFNTQTSSEISKMANTFDITGKPKDFLYLFQSYVKQPILDQTDLHPFLYVCYKEGTTLYNKFKEKLMLKKPE